MRAQIRTILSFFAFRTLHRLIGPIACAGWSGLDELYRVVPGELSVVTGVPNSGKSEWLDALLCNLVGQRGWSFALCSMENKVGAPTRLAEEYYPSSKGNTVSWAARMRDCRKSLRLWRLRSRTFCISVKRSLYWSRRQSDVVCKANFEAALLIARELKATAGNLGE